MDEVKSRIRHALLYEFDLSHTPGEAARNLHLVFGDDALSERSCRDWFNRFFSGDRNIEDRPRSGAPSQVDSDQLLALIKADPRQSIRDLALVLGCHHSTIDRLLAKLGKVSKYGSWVPHSLSQDELDNRAEVCVQLLSRSRRMDWLDLIVTGDEKWVLYANHSRKRQWVSVGEQAEPEPKPELHQRKVMLSVWWNVHGVIHYELLPAGATITAISYCDQLQRVQHALQRARPQQEKVYFLHDNARPHSAKMTRQKIIELGWEQLPHPPYSPDLAPTDYHLFRSLEHTLRDKQYDDQAHLEQDLREFFQSKPPEFYATGIRKLPTRWQEVIDNNGEYIIDP